MVPSSLVFNHLIVFNRGHASCWRQNGIVFRYCYALVPGGQDRVREHPHHRLRCNVASGVDRRKVMMAGCDAQFFVSDTIIFMLSSLLILLENLTCSFN